MQEKHQEHMKDTYIVMLSISQVCFFLELIIIRAIWGTPKLVCIPISCMWVRVKFSVKDVMSVSFD